MGEWVGVGGWVGEWVEGWVDGSGGGGWMCGWVGKGEGDRRDGRMSECLSGW